MKKSKVISTILTICMAVSMLTGCGKTKEVIVEETTTESSSRRDRGEGTEETIDPEIMETVKYNLYVELNNYIVEVLDNIDYYYSVVEYEEEFALIPDSGLTYGYNITYLDTDILEDVAAVVKEEPAFETLDELTANIIEPMRTMMEIFNDINSARDYADNQYEKPKKFHETVYKNAGIFYSLGLDYLAAVDELANERIEEEEAGMLADGNLIIYNCSHAITVADAIIDACYDQEVYDDNITELDLEAIRPLYDELVATVAAYDEAVKDNDQLVKESLSSAPFDGLLNSMVQSVDYMIQQVESGNEIEDISLAPLGSIAHISDVLSQCIDRYNDVFTE